MPALKNPRHERFAQRLAEGMTQVEAYTGAGYRGRPESHAARLAGRADVQARVAAYLESDRLRRTGFATLTEPEPEPLSDAEKAAQGKSIC